MHNCCTNCAGERNLFEHFETFALGGTSVFGHLLVLGGNGKKHHVSVYLVSIKQSKLYVDELEILGPECSRRLIH